MKQANLISILGAFKNLDADIFELYLDYYSIQIKIDELKDLEVLVSDMKQCGEAEIFDKYFIGYEIPQISKEFDLFRIDDLSIINIELKRKKDSDKIQKQLIQNKYYLSFLQKEVHNFCYVTEEKKIYTINKENILIEANMNDLFEVLMLQKTKNIVDIDSLFNPVNYLVSPFNSTEKFIGRKYFLTDYQDRVKKNILDEIGKSGHSLIGVKGKAGTGKTLLTYDIARDATILEKTLIVHCGLLNNAHIVLRKEYGWNIVKAKALINLDLSKYHLIVIDEAQRLYSNQFEFVINEVKKFSNNCIFSYDEEQTLSKVEINRDIAGKIEDILTVLRFKLTEKIRTNKEVDYFIQRLIYKDKALHKFSFSGIEITYFENDEEAKDYLSNLRLDGCKTINFTPSLIHNAL